MTLQFKKTSDDMRKLNKSFVDIGNPISAVPTQNSSIIGPVWLVAYNSSFAEATHVFCSDFGRTYYITDIILTTGGKCYIHATVDVLTTYANKIKLCSGTVLRSESIGEPTLIPDGKMPVHTNKRIIDAINFPDTPFSRDFTNLNPYILTTIGGSSLPGEGGSE